MTTLTIPQLQKWYKNQLAKSSKDFIKQAEKSYKVVERSLRDVEAIAIQLKDASKEEDSDAINTSSRFANKISEIVSGFDVKSDITYESTEAMQAEIQYFIQELWGAGARWIRRMDKKYKNVIKQLDDYMKELMKELKKIGKLLYEYQWVRDLERIGGRIESLRELTYGKEQFEVQIRGVQLKRQQALEEYKEAKKVFHEFKEASNVSDLLNLDEEQDHLSRLLTMELNTLRKAVKKFQQQDTGVRISPSGQKALTDYFEDPYLAITEDRDGYPDLLEGLSGIEEAIERDSLKLKDRLARRSIEEIEKIRKGSLKELQKKAKNVEKKKTEFAGSDIYAKNRRLAEELEEAKRNLEYHSNDLLRIGDDIKRQISKVEEFRERIESEIYKAFNEKVKIVIEDLGLEPLLEKCKVEPVGATS